MRNKLLTAAVCCLFAASAYAEKSLTQNEVKVTATRSEKSAIEVPVTLSVVTDEEIAMSGSVTLAELLRDIPGVQLTSTGSTGIFRISLRGESASRSLIMVDGVKISEQKSMDGAPLLIDPASIERIEVIKGPSSVLYGSDAIGGVVNIITKKGGTKPLQGSISTTYDTGTGGLSKSLSLFGNSQGFYYRAEMTDTNQGNRRDTDNDEIEYTAFESTNFRGVIGYKNDRIDMSYEKTIYDSDNEVRTGYEDVVPSGSDMRMEMNLPRWDREKDNFHFEFKNPGSALGRVKADLFMQNTFKEFINNMYMSMMGSVFSYKSNTQNDLDTLGLNTQADFNLSSTNLLITGFEYMKDDLEAVEVTKSFMAPAYSNYLSKANQQSVSLFAQDEQAIGDFVITGGLRYTQTETELSESNKTGLTPGSSDDSSTVGSLSLTYNGVKNTTFRALVATGYRTANLQQLYMGTTHGSSTPTYSNPDLEAETSVNYEIGARYRGKHLDADATLFLTEADDYITTASTSINGSDAYQYTNIDKATTKGLELTAGYEIFGFRPYVELTLLNREYKFETYTTDKNGMPETFGRTGISYSTEIGKNMSLNADIYVRYADDAEDEESSGDITEVEGYTTLNASVSGIYRFSDGRRFFLSVEALNINNQEYTLAMATMEEPGSHVIFKAGLDF